MKMSHDETLQIITHIIREVLELPNLHLNLETSAADVDEWDSMTHIQIIAGIEAHYKIRFALGELQALKNVGEMVQLIQKKLSK